MFLKNLPQGWLPGVEAARRLARRKYCDSPIGRLEEEELWRELCEHTFERRVRAVIFTRNGATADADCGQFVALGSRYNFQVDTLSSWLESEQCHIEIEMQPDCEFLDKHGRVVRGHLLFHESDLEALFADGSPEKPSSVSESDIETVFGAPASLEKPSFDEVCAPGNKPLPADDGHVEESSSPCRKVTSKQNKVDALAAFLRKRYSTRPAMFVDELMEAVKNEAPQIGTFKKRTFEDALAITYPQPQSAKFRKVT
jgi:hypothetical protein